MCRRIALITVLSSWPAGPGAGQPPPNRRQNESCCFLEVCPKLDDSGRGLLSGSPAERAGRKRTAEAVEDIDALVRSVAAGARCRAEDQVLAGARRQDSTFSITAEPGDRAGAEAIGDRHAPKPKATAELVPDHRR